MPRGRQAKKMKCFLPGVNPAMNVPCCVCVLLCIIINQGWHAWFSINETLLSFSWFISGGSALFHALHKSMSSIRGSLCKAWIQGLCREICTLSWSVLCTYHINVYHKCCIHIHVVHKHILLLCTVHTQPPHWKHWLKNRWVTGENFRRNWLAEDFKCIDCGINCVPLSQNTRHKKVTTR